MSLVINEEGKRNNSIDFLRLVCSFLIVCIHFPFPSEVGKYIVAIARIAVPIFLMISGYYFDIRYMRKLTRKILRLILVSNLLYFLWDIIADKVNLSLLAFLKLIIVNESPFASHLWYLNALLYVYFIIVIFDKIKCEKIVYFFVPVLLCVDLMFGKYSLLIWGKEFPFVLVRNFIFVGVPYFYIGILIRRKKIYIGIWGIPFFLIMTIIERFLLERTGYNTVRDHYISTTFLAIAILCYALKSNVNINETCRKFLKCTTGIYIVHPMIGEIFNKIIDGKAIKETVLFVYPVIIFFVSLFVVLLWHLLNDRIEKLVRD